MQGTVNLEDVGKSRQGAVGCRPRCGRRLVPGLADIEANTWREPKRLPLTLLQFCSVSASTCRKHTWQVW